MAVLTITTSILVGVGILRLAAVSRISFKAHAVTRGCIAFTTAGAYLAGLGASASHDIGTRRALLNRAVGAGETKVADATADLIGVPRTVVKNLFCSCVVVEVILVQCVVTSNLLLRLAHASFRALVRARRPLAGGPRVAIEALALARLCVAVTFTRTLEILVVDHSFGSTNYLLVWGAGEG